MELVQEEQPDNTRLLPVRLHLLILNPVEAGVKVEVFLLRVLLQEAVLAHLQEAAEVLVARQEVLVAEAAALVVLDKKAIGIS